ncbi:MAG: 3D domain-containing protein [Desulfobaccales bacterium]
MRTLTIICLVTLGLAFLPQTTMGVNMSIVSVTAYSYFGGQSPYNITASGKKVKEGMVAVSRDVERHLNLTFGDRVLLHGLGVFEFQDRMAPRWTRKADVFMHSNHEARRFGVRRHVVLVKLV